MDDRTVKINLRIPQHLLDRIDQQSVKYRRSRNSEILACIEFATEYSFAEKELEPEMRQASPQALIALAEALGAVEHNSWTADGLLCRRYITADGSIDLTVRVP